MIEDNFYPENELVNRDNNTSSTEEVTTYRGSNTMSRVFLLPMALVLSFASMWVLSLVVFIIGAVTNPRWLSTDGYGILLLVSIIVFGGAVYYWREYRHYSTVVLTNVQTVIPKLGETGVTRAYRLEITVTINGEERTEYTHQIFDSNGLPLIKYVDKPHKAGYDPIRGRWIIID